MTNNLFNTLTEMATIAGARFGDNATSRQIGFIVAIARNNNIATQTIVDAIEFYNGGENFGFDKECASALIASYATDADLKQRAEKVRR